MRCSVCNATLSGDVDLDPQWLQHWQAHVATCQLDVLQRIAIALENTAEMLARINDNGVAVKS